MADDLDKVMQRAQRYWYQDGLPEIAAGILLLVGGLALSLMAAPMVAPGTVLALLLALGLIILATIIEVVVGKGVKSTIDALKNRLTYPRTGYVSYRQPAPKKRSLPARIGLLLGLMVVSMVGAALVTAILTTARLPEWLMSMSATQGLIFAVMLGFMGRQYGLWRFYGLAAVSLGTGGVVAINDPTFNGGALYFLIMGVILTLTGLLSLTFYLRRYRSPEEE